MITGHFAIAFDLGVTVYHTGGPLRITWEFNSDLFDESTIARMADHFQTLLESVVSDPDQPIAEIPLLDSAERDQLLQWNQTQMEFPSEDCFQQLFQRQVERTPDAVSLVWENTQLTYDELNCQANQLAHYLKKLDVGPANHSRSKSASPGGPSSGMGNV